VLGEHLGPCHIAGTVPWPDAILRSSGAKRGLVARLRIVVTDTEVPVAELADVWGDPVVTLAH
jgi:hypothetical protein